MILKTILNTKFFANGFAETNNICVIYFTQLAQISTNRPLTQIMPFHNGVGGIIINLKKAVDNKYTLEDRCNPF